MATVWAYRTDPGHGIRAVLEGGRVEWQIGAERGWSTLQEIRLAAQIHSSPAMVEVLRNVVAWAEEDMRLHALAVAEWTPRKRELTSEVINGERLWNGLDSQKWDAERARIFLRADKHREAGRWEVTT